MAHADQCLTHDENRKKVCIKCFQKAKYQVTDIVLARIRNFFISTYDIGDQTLPCGICGKCRADLIDISNGRKPSEILPPPYNFSEINPHIMITRSDPFPYCECQICETARLSGKSTPRRKHGRPPRLSNDSSTDSSRHPMMICGTCKSLYGKGLSHKCSVKSLRDNIVRMCSSADQNTQDMVAASILTSTPTLKQEPKTLYSGGSHRLQVHIGESPSSSSSSKIGFKDLTNLQSVLSASNNQLNRKIVPFIRSVFGRSSVESNIAIKLQER